MVVRTSTIVPFDIDEVFAWHQRRGALVRLMPPWQPLTVRREPNNLADGRAELRLPGGLTWVAQHRECEPPRRFVDELTSLPLPWRHIHRFEAVDDTHTRVIDEVDTPVPAALLRATFAYRHRQLRDDLELVRQAASWQASPMTVAVTGASGLVGTALVALLGMCGHRVIRLVRRSPTSPTERHWDPRNPDAALLTGVHALVHLAGASIAGRFSEQHKRNVTTSRIGPTRALAELVAALPDGPSVLVCASAIGYYGPDRHDEPLNEQTEPGHGFLADVVRDWEAATHSAAQAGRRVAHIRTGIVQSPRGGTLQLLRPLFTAGLGGRLGTGQQWTSWIDLDDLCDIYRRAVLDETLSGPINATAPEPVRNATYTDTLAHVLRRPALIPVPELGPRLLLGTDGARELALASQRVVPSRLLRAGHRFRRPHLEACLRHQLGRTPA